jgi:HEAT repeat protein
MNLFFCPQCRQPFESIQTCPNCSIATDALAKTYVEKLLDTILSKDTSRMGMAVDVLTKWLHEPRVIVPLTLLVERKSDPYPLVVGARGLGWLGNPAAVPALGKLLLNESQPYVARVAAAEALGRIGGKDARPLLEQARKSPRSSVAEASARALEQFRE